MPVYHALIEHGDFTQVLVCNAGHVKNVPGRKTDPLTELPEEVPVVGGQMGFLVATVAHHDHRWRCAAGPVITLGIVHNGLAVTIADGTRASPGNLIIYTHNDHRTEAGKPGRTLANGDLLRIDAITRNGLLVRRALDPDPRTGQRRWTERPFLYANY